MTAMRSLWAACICWSAAFAAMALGNLADALDWDLAAFTARLIAPCIALGALAFQARSARQACEPGTITLTLPSRLR